jgi:hypothetical protein
MFSDAGCQFWYGERRDMRTREAIYQAVSHLEVDLTNP